MKIDKATRFTIQMITACLIATAFIMFGAYLQATSPDPRSAISHVVFILKLLVGAAVFAGLGFLTEAE